MNSLIVIIGNPAARSSSIKKIGSAALSLEQKGFETEILLTQKSGHATELAHDCLSRKPFMIIAAGGDGTINEVINGIAGSEIPLAILPMGTTNVLAKELGIPENIPGAVEPAVSSKPKMVSLGRIELTQDTLPISRYFCLMAGIGYDGKAVHDVNLKIKNISGKIAYILSGLKNFLTYTPEELNFIVDGVQHSGYSAIICNASRYGGHLKVAPDADISEPFLYTCIFKGKKRTDLLRYVLGIIRGNHIKSPDVVYLKSSAIEVKGNAHIQIDGDYIGRTPARISIERDILRLIY
jgi:diacylglycerol kinase (ATP)